MTGSAATHQIRLRPGERFHCTWPWETITLLSDGIMVCGCADPYKGRPAGNAAILPVRDIWNGPVFRAIREGLHANNPMLCSHCNLMGTTADKEQKLPAEVRVKHLPRRLFVEPSISCNLSCYESCCNHEKGIHRTRHSRLLAWETFTRVVDELGPGLWRLEFFNYGESFVHPRAIEMIRYAKSRHPNIFLFCSTNGLLLNTDKKLRALVESGIDEITFSIDGATQESYARYRRGGDFNKVIRNLRRLVEIRKEMGAETPFINWRYILFRWNDGDAEMDLARRIAAEIDIDRLCWEITDHPENSASQRFLPGTADYERISLEVWSALSNAMPNKRLRCAIGPPATMTAAAGQTFTAQAVVNNTGGATWRHASACNRRHITLGIKLLDENRNMVDPNFGRAPLPRSLASGESAVVDFRCAAPPRPGRYWLQFDMVCEAIEWFESCGNPPAFTSLEVR